MSGADKSRRLPSGRASIADAMLLVAATAVGLAACRYTVEGFLGGSTSLFRPFAPFERGVNSLAVVISASDFMAIALTLVGGWTFILPLIRVRSQRIGRRRLLRQPGFSACLAAMCGMLAGGLNLAVTFGIDRVVGGRRHLPLPIWVRLYVFDDLIVDAGLVVAAVWLFQALAGRWRARADWVDRAGRFLGVVWIVAGMVWASRRYSPFL